MGDPSITQQALEEWGATVERLPTSSKEESDWLASLDGCRLLIEEKKKLDDPDREVARAVAFQVGEVHVSTMALSRSNRLSGIVRKAANQLASTGSDLSHDLRVFWLTAVGMDSEARYHQFIATLYGSSNVLESNDRGSRWWRCYFFRNSEFFRFSTQLDGAIAAFLFGDTVTMRLCLNPYSQCWEALRDSPFAKQLHTGLMDPIAEEAAGEALIADTEIDRNDSTAVLNYLQSKYETGRLMNMDVNMTSAIWSNRLTRTAFGSGYGNEKGG